MRRKNIIEKVFFKLGISGYIRFLSDEQYLKLMYKCQFGKNLDLKNPKTFNEKLQWLKLRNNTALHTKMVDKYEVKDYVAQIIGDDYIIPTIGVWDKFDDIEFECLPDQFVLKCTHDSGGLVICKDKKQLNKTSAKKKIEKSLKKNYYWAGRELQYKNVKPRIIAEPYLEDSEFGELRDYKFFVFSGKCKLLYIASDRGNEKEETKFDFFDDNFTHLDFTNGHPNSKIPPSKPLNFEKMKSMAELLAKGFPHLRVDFYEVNGKVYFGELTFSHWSGLIPFEPEEWDYKLGDWLMLN